MAELLRERFAALSNPLDDSDWLDVRRRAGLSTRRRPVWIALAAAVAAGAVLLATPALGLRGRIVQLFEESDPASQPIIRAFETFDTAVPQNMDAPGVIAEQTREVIEIPVAPRREAVMWVAPTTRGTFCTLVGVRKVGAPGNGGGGGCVEGATGFSAGMGIPGPVSPTGEILEPPVLVYGTVQMEAATTLEIRFEGGSSESVPLVWVSEPLDAGFFVYSVPRAHWQEGRRPTALVVLDEEGHELARDTELVRMGWPR
jgi:hypothetical protein